MAMLSFKPIRRSILKSVSALCLLPMGRWAANAAEKVSRPLQVPATSLSEVLLAYGINEPVSSSPHISLQVPEVAENGASVPISVAVEWDGVRKIVLLAEANRFPLLLAMEVKGELLPQVDTRIRLTEGSSAVSAYVQRQGKWFYTSRPVQVMTGGCGPVQDDGA